MALAVMVLSYNHPELTARAVRSALSAGAGRVILVHNGSAPKHEAALRGNFPGVFHLSLDPNRGYSGGVNAGLAEGFRSHDWAVVLTNDSELLNLPTPPAQPAVVAPVVLRRKTERVDSAGGLFFPEQAKLRHCRTAGEFRSPAAKASYPYIPGTVFLLHREVFEGAGPLDEALCIYWDDVEWSMRARAAGFPLTVDETWSARHGMSKTGQGNPLYSLYYFQRNRKRVCWTFSRPYRRPLLAARLAADWLRLSVKALIRRRFDTIPYFWRILSE